MDNQLCVSSQQGSSDDIRHTKAASGTCRKFVERQLLIEDKNFLIAPNGGTGDCCFKAISQAIEGTEVDHHKIREDVVNFVVNHRWDKFKESIEVQHVHGNQVLQKSWIADPLDTYQVYMNTSGTLGSSSELHAAGELFHYNFVTIQEYADQNKNTYRVENCCPFDDPSVPFHYFYFTGDFDNGHWEYLEPLHGCSTTETIPDGLYPGVVKVIIDGTGTTVDEWLKIHTHNTNDEFQLKHSITRYRSKKSSHPFESEEFSYNSDNCVVLKGLQFHVAKLNGTDLFTVLLGTIFPEMTQTDAKVLDRLEDQIVNYRVKNNAFLNYKIITQPHSHGFDIQSLKYVGMTCKGNVQDLLAAADLFGFSFEIFIKPEKAEPVHSCRFVHVDRWGGETDRVLHFFMRLTTDGPVMQDEAAIAKWWFITPQFEGNNDSSEPNHNDVPNWHQVGDLNDSQFRRVMSGSSKIGSAYQEVSVSESGDDGESTKKIVMSHSASCTDDEEEEEEDDNSESDSSDAEQEENEEETMHHEELFSEELLAVTAPSHPVSQESETKSMTIRASKTEIKLDETSCAGVKPARRVHTQVVIYDDVTQKRREYRFPGVRSRDEVLTKLLNRGYIKSIPVELTDPLDESHEEKERGGTRETPSWYMEHVVQHAQLIDNHNTQQIIKSDSSIMKASEKFANSANIVNGNEFHGRNEIGSRAQLDKQDLNNENDQLIMESCENLMPYSSHKSVSAVALVNQDSVERNSKFLALHQRVSPWAQKKDNLEAPKNIFQRFLSWINSIFQSCRRKVS